MHSTIISLHDILIDSQEIISQYRTNKSARFEQAHKFARTEQIQNFNSGRVSKNGGDASDVTGGGS
tara:strand:- start:11 stop:208 length:198 start_codon:yes stop_codon:yes gene_type:complete